MRIGLIFTAVAGYKKDQKNEINIIKSNII